MAPGALARHGRDSGRAAQRSADPGTAVNRPSASEDRCPRGPPGRSRSENGAIPVGERADPGRRTGRPRSSTGRFRSEFGCDSDQFRVRARVRATSAIPAFAAQSGHALRFPTSSANTRAKRSETCDPQWSQRGMLDRHPPLPARGIRDQAPNTLVRRRRTRAGVKRLDERRARSGSAGGNSERTTRPDPARAPVGRAGDASAGRSRGRC